MAGNENYKVLPLKLLWALSGCSCGRKSYWSNKRDPKTGRQAAKGETLGLLLALSTNALEHRQVVYKKELVEGELPTDILEHDDIHTTCVGGGLKSDDKPFPVMHKQSELFKAGNDSCLLAPTSS